MYDNLMNKFKFGGLDNPNIYLDETVTRMCWTHRRIFAQLATRLMEEGKMDKAAKLVEYVEKVIPGTTVKHNYSSGSMDLARIWLKVGNVAQVEKLLSPIVTNAAEYLEWYLSLPNSMMIQEEEEIMYYMYQMHHSIEVLQEAKSPLALDYVKRLDQINTSIQHRLYGGLGQQPQEEPADMPLLPIMDEAETDTAAL